MMGQAAIRRARPADAPALSEFGAATFTDAFGHLYRAEDLAFFLADSHSPAYYEEFIGDPETAIWVAEGDDGKLAGYAAAGPCGLPVEAMPAGSGELKRIYVAKEAQGSGLGKALLEAALDWLEGRFHHVYLGVFSENARAQALYRRYGFEKVAEYSFMVGNQADHEWIMKKTASRA